MSSQTHNASNLIERKAERLRLFYETKLVDGSLIIDPVSCRGPLWLGQQPALSLPTQPIDRSVEALASCSRLGQSRCLFAGDFSLEDDASVDHHCGHRFHPVLFCFLAAFGSRATPLAYLAATIAAFVTSSRVSLQSGHPALNTSIVLFATVSYLVVQQHFSRVLPVFLQRSLSPFCFRSSTLSFLFPLTRTRASCQPRRRPKRRRPRRGAGANI